MICVTYRRKRQGSLLYLFQHIQADSAHTKTLPSINSINYSFKRVFVSIHTRRRWRDDLGGFQIECLGITKNGVHWGKPLPWDTIS